ncbi:MAG TPA: WG repeat-containing protein [Pyrinomonadaceae bacterium]|nr:WG repeat-containing protein [Pyrinomonadaceae bacterium]
MVKLFILISLMMFAGAAFAAGRTFPAPATEEDETELFPIYERGKVGYIDRTGKIVIEPRFDFGDVEFRGSFTDKHFFSMELAAVAECSGANRRCKFGFIDRSGKFVVPPVFDNVQPFSFEGLAAVKTDGRWGFIDRAGQLVIALQFVEAEPFRDGFARAMLHGGRKVLVNRQGKFLRTPPGMQDLGLPSHKRVAVKIRGKWGFIDTSGNLVIRPRFEPVLNDYGEDDYVGEFASDLAAVMLKGRWGYVNTEGRLVIPPKFYRAEPFRDISVSIAAEALSSWGVINKTGDFVSRRRFYAMHDFSEDAAAAQVGDKWGFVDREGRLLIPATFEQVGFFSEGLAAARIGRKWGYIDHAGKFVIEPQFDSESYFRNGLASQTIRPYSPSAPGQWGYIDRTGRFVWKSAD